MTVQLRVGRQGEEVRGTRDLVRSADFPTYSHSTSFSFSRMYFPLPPRIWIGKCARSVRGWTQVWVGLGCTWGRLRRGRYKRAAARAAKRDVVAGNSIILRGYVFSTFSSVLKMGEDLSCGFRARLIGSFDLVVESGPFDLESEDGVRLTDLVSA